MSDYPCCLCDGTGRTSFQYKDVDDLQVRIKALELTIQNAKYGIKIGTADGTRHALEILAEALEVTK